MNRCSLRSAAAFAALLMLLAAPAARADEIVTAANISGPLGLFTFDAFNPNFLHPFTATLDEVDVEVLGNITTVVAPPANLFTFDPLAPPVPVPYTLDISAGLDFTAIFGGFSTASELPYALYGEGVADGTGDPTTVVIPVNYAFSFDASTDVSDGLAVATDFDQETALLADFLPQPFDEPTMENFAVDNANWDPFGPDNEYPAFGTAVVDGSANLSLLITYDYTLSAPVPEPSSLALLGAGIIAAMGRRRRRQAASTAPRTR